MVGKVSKPCQPCCISKQIQSKLARATASASDGSVERTKPPIAQLYLFQILLIGFGKFISFGTFTYCLIFMPISLVSCPRNKYELQALTPPKLNMGSASCTVPKCATVDSPCIPFSNSNSGIGSASFPATCVHRSPPTSITSFAV